MRWIYLLVFLLWANLASAQITNFYGFGSVNVPTEKGEKYQFRWVRAGVKVTDSWYQVVYEYDLPQADTKYAYTRVFKDLAGGEVSLLFGKFLSPVPYLYPSPKSLRPVRWAEVLDNYSIYALGTSLWYKKDEFTFRLANYGSNQLAMALTFHELSLFWERDVGYGFILESPWNNWLLNPWLGISVYDDGRQVISIQNYIQLPHKVRLYVLIDLGDRLSNSNGKRPTNGQQLVGATWEFNQNSFLKVYYEGKKDKLSVEGTFFFTLNK